MSDHGRRVEGLVEAARRLAPLIQAHADENERERRLAPAVVEAFHGAGLFRALVPGRFGGAGLDMAEAMPLFEEVAAADGSSAAGRDLHAVSQHFALSSAHFERLGKIRLVLGLDPRRGPI